MAPQILFESVFFIKTVGPGAKKNQKSKGHSLARKGRFALSASDQSQEV
jgi:hypothetical protein